MKIISLIFLILFASTTAHFGQEADVKKHQFPQVTLTLSPIVKDGAYYVFNGARGTFESVMIPLTLLNDKDVNVCIKKSKVTRGINRAMMLASVVYVFYDFNTNTNSQTRADRNRVILLGSLVMSQVLSIMESSYKRRAVNRYNDVIFKPQASLLPGNTLCLGIQVKF